MQYTQSCMYTHIGRPYAYGTMLCPIRIWDTPYAYGTSHTHMGQHTHIGQNNNTKYVLYVTVNSSSIATCIHGVIIISNRNRLQSITGFLVIVIAIAILVLKCYVIAITIKYIAKIIAISDDFSITTFVKHRIRSQHLV